MHTTMMVFPAPKSETRDGDKLYEWTSGDLDSLEFRYRRHHEPQDDDFACFVADALVGDAIDADVMWRAVVSCNTLREHGRMRTDWLIEECERRHTLEIDLKKPCNSSGVV